MSDSINSLSSNFRDFLLNRNLITDTITENGLEGLLVGIGVPITNIGTPPEAVQPSSDINEDGELYKDLNVVTNQFQGTDDDYQKVNIAYVPPTGPPTSAFIYSSNYTDDNGILEDTINLQPVRDFSQGGDIRQYNTSFNLYDDADKRTVTNLNYIPGPNVKYTNYLDLNSNIINSEIDILGSIFNGQGIGFGDGQGINAIQPSFDLRSTLLGRVLGGTGVISDTPLGQAGAKYLALSLANNIAFGLQQETIGHLNLNPLSLAMNGLDSFIVPNYDITVPKGKLGRVLDFGARVLGFEVPVSLFDRSSSIFSTENPIGNIERANAQLANTGKGQVLSFFANVNMNKYKPRFKDDRVTGVEPNENDKTQKGSEINPDIYAFNTSDGNVTDFLNNIQVDLNDKSQSNDSNSPISQSNYKLDGLINNSGFHESPNGESEYGEDGTYVDKYIWGDDKPNNAPGKRIFGDSTKFGDSKTLLGKTKNLFASNKMRTIVSGKASLATKGEIQSAVHGDIGTSTMSKGSGVLSQRALDGDFSVPEDVYCRAWTTFDRYNQVEDLQKHSGINGTTAYREGLDESVLGDNGFVKIGPYSNEAGSVTGENIKNFMFSIENLAWADDHAKLLPCETGPGDQFGKRGRIMWFPPYDLSVNENNSVNWDATNFIGRGEPIYTYSNTERTGTLQFKIVVDHPSYLNAIRDQSDDYIASFFAGCTEITKEMADKLTVEEKNEIISRNQLTDQQKDAADISPDIPFLDFYFPNNVAVLNDTYENQFSLSGGGLGSIMSTGDFIGGARKYVDKTDFGLNGDKAPGALKAFGGWISAAGQNELKKLLNEQCQACKIRVFGYASVAGGATNKGNQKLSDARAEAVKVWFKTKIFDDTSPIYGNGEGQITMDERFEKSEGKGVDDGGDAQCPVAGQPAASGATDTADFYGCKIHRKVNVNFLHDKILQAKLNKNIGDDKIVEEKYTISTKIINRFYNECNYFETLKQENSFVYDTLKQKLKHFHPAFHSITPEGLNSRLTFLLQCTRQGPTNIKDKPDNLAFGRPPICILRLGDFYHTKIAIDNVGITYEPLVWDLNPEGIGVQPMIATVDLSFKMIGGQSLRAPINKLQNAVSFNFFGNTQVYDVRADKLKKNNGEFEYVQGLDVLESLPPEVTIEPTGSYGNTPENDQVVVGEGASSAQVDETGGIDILDIEILKDIRWFFGNNSIEDGGVIQTVWVTKEPILALTGLTKEYKFEIDMDISDGADGWVPFMRNQTIKVSDNGPDRSVTSTPKWTDYIVSGDAIVAPFSAGWFTPVWFKVTIIIPNGQNIEVKIFYLAIFDDCPKPAGSNEMSYFKGELFYHKWEDILEDYNNRPTC